MKIVLIKSDNKVMLLATCLLVFSIYFDATSNYGSLYYFSLIFAVGLISLIRKGIFSFFEYYPISIFLLVSVLISTLLSQTDDVVGCFAQIAFFICSILFGFQLYRINKEYIYYLLNIITMTLFVASGFGIYEYFSGINIFQSMFVINYLQYTDRVASFFGHPITFASILLVGIIYTWFAPRKFIVKVIVLGIFLFCLYGTMSRSSWLAFAVITILYVLRSNKNKLTLENILIFMVGIVIVIIFYNSSFGHSIIIDILLRISDIDGSVSSNQRLGTISLMLNEVFANSTIFEILIGHGERASKNFMQGAVIIIKDFGTTDNWYIQCLYNYGLIFILCIAYCLFSLVKNVVTGEQFSVLSWILISQLIAGFFFELSENHSVAFIFLTVLGAWLCERLVIPSKTSIQELTEAT